MRLIFSDRGARERARAAKLRKRLEFRLEHVVRAHALRSVKGVASIALALAGFRLRGR
jgi:hypothetical protein